MKESYTLKLEGKEWKDCLKDTYNKKKKDIKMDGFRKGQVPYDVYVKKMGVETLYMDSVDSAVDILYAKLLSDPKTITPAATPAIDIKNIDENHVEIEFTLVSTPEVKLGKYKGLGIKKEKVEVTEEEIEHELHHIKEHFAEVKTLDDKTKIKEGMTAVINFEGFKDGVAFEGGKGEDYSLEIGSHTFIPGFEEALVGLKKGDKKDVKVTFPENYGEASLAGKAAVFKVTVHEVKEQKLPEFTDEYVKTLNKDVNNYDELKAAKRKELEATKAQTEKDRQTNDLINKIIDNATVDMPKTLVDSRYNAMKSQYENQAKMYNIPFETFIQIMGSTLEQFEDITRKQAERQALFDVVAGAIIEAEKLVPTKEEIDAKVGDDKKANRVQIMNELTYQKLVDFLLANAKEI